MNTITGGNGNNDGILRGWVDDSPAFEKTDLRFRDIDSLKVENVWFNIYIGGSWTAAHDMHLYFDNMVISPNRVGCYQDGTGGAGGAGTGGSSAGGSGGTGGSGAAAGSGGGGASSGGTGGAAASPGDAEDDSGCGCRQAGAAGGGSAAASLGLLLALCGLARRKRRLA
jgi:hypothetical protein